MGIKDLLKFMKPYIKPIHIKKYAGKRVGIDAYSWLHKGAYSCSMEICLDSNSDKKLRYLDYFMHRINLLRHYEIIPVVVFDGGNIPCKAATENERYKKRNVNFELAMEKLNEGNVGAATDFFQRAVNVSPLMAHGLIQILRSENIEFVVAPYEADAQLAYLSSLEPEKGGIEAVITEDSDLLAYGSQTTIFKMDRFGNGEVILLDKVFNAVACKPSFQSFDGGLFTGMCVLAGCDFLPSVPGIGIAKAHSFVSKHRNLDRVLSVLKSQKGNQMPEDYAKSFKEALAVFQHARIYDPFNKALKHRKPLPQNFMEAFDEKLDFLGPMNFPIWTINGIRKIPALVASAIAEGKLNPRTMEAFDCFPSSDFPVGIVQNSRKHLKSKAKLVARQKSCFESSASHRSTSEDSTGVVVQEESVSTERKYVIEALALQKVILPSESHLSVASTVTSGVQMKVPNNPFKMRKPDETNLDQRTSCNEEASVMIEDGQLNVTSITPEGNLYQSHLTPCNTQLKVPNDGHCSKRKFDKIHMDRSESFAEEAPVVTDVRNSDISFIVKESQGSVNSKAKIIPDGMGRSKSGNSKKSNDKNLENQKRTILSFFSRV